MRAPDGLGPSGRALWRRVHEGAEGLNAIELETLRLACATVDTAAQLEREAKGMPRLVRGSGDQQVLNPLLREARLQRSAAASMLARLKMEPEEPEERTGRMSKRQRDRQRDQLAEARRNRWPRAAS